MVQSLGISIPTITVADAQSIDVAATDAVDEHPTVTFDDIPLTELSKTTRRQLSSLLNTRKILRSEEGYERDWRGIAALAEQKNLCDESSLCGDDPMAKVLEWWCKNNPKIATFANLERFLGIIDRWDVSDDINESLVEDAKRYNTQLRKQCSLSTASGTNELPQASNELIKECARGSDPNILTNDDVSRALKNLSPQLYDAFVLYAEADMSYVGEMVKKLEDNPKYNFKLCLKHRNLLAGVSFEHVALTQLIEERCKHLIVIITQEFFKSPENKFLVDYAQALQIQQKTRKIIPLIYESTVTIPPTLNIYTKLHYTTNARLYDFWDKLASSIHNVSLPVEAPKIAGAQLSSYSRSTMVSKGDTSDLNLPSPAIITPRIKINDHGMESADEEEETSKSNNSHVFKKRDMHEKKIFTSKNGLLRNAHSTSGLNSDYFTEKNASLSDLSTASSSYELKKKKKWPKKIFNKVFSRSSTKLQEPA